MGRLDGFLLWTIVGGERAILYFSQVVLLSLFLLLNPPVQVPTFKDHAELFPGVVDTVAAVEAVARIAQPVLCPQRLRVCPLRSVDVRRTDHVSPRLDRVRTVQREREHRRGRRVQSLVFCALQLHHSA